MDNSIKYRIFLIILCLQCAMNLSAQEKGVNRFEVGVGYSPFFLSQMGDGFYKKYDINAYAEWRHYVSRSFSLGARFDYKTGRVVAYNDMTHLCTMLATLNYGRTDKSKIWGFLNVGLGPGIQFQPFPFETTVYCCLNPRIGIDFYSRLRLAVGVDLTLLSAYYWPATITLGWVF